MLHRPTRDDVDLVAVSTCDQDIGILDAGLSKCFDGRTVAGYREHIEVVSEPVEPNGTFTYVNPAFANRFGYTSPELVDEHWAVLYDDDQSERLENDILPAVAETGYWAGETVRLTKHRDRLITDHRLAKTSMDAIVCTARDVTQERSSPPDQTVEYDLLFDAVEDHSFYTPDHERYITRWNEGAKRLEGYDSTEILVLANLCCYRSDVLHGTVRDRCMLNIQH